MQTRLGRSGIAGISVWRLNRPFLNFGAFWWLKYWFTFIRANGSESIVLCRALSILCVSGSRESVLHYKFLSLFASVLMVAKKLPLCAMCWLKKALDEICHVRRFGVEHLPTDYIRWETEMNVIDLFFPNFCGTNAALCGINTLFSQLFVSKFCSLRFWLASKN